ncbi:MAG: 1,4-alpha-glucan branching protein GlgB [Verrucomicrobia bacterium]|nr:1,4-alpha-glucan branching protein GlgB [Verrucomicrobiota bacterium]
MVARLEQGGAFFEVWAPCAQSVAVVGDFNQWQPHAMERQGEHWRLFIPSVKEGQYYQFYVTTAQGNHVYKADPGAFFAEKRPLRASILFDVNRHQWQDQEWMAKRTSCKDRPLNIYEVHLGSWRSGVSYRESASELADYCLKMGFTHLELLPLTEYPLDESWGYQVTGYYAVTSRYGTPEEFQRFVDHLHQRGIGVILDWVPGHFPTDAHGLALFDGTPLYEDQLQGLHPDWTTHTFDFSRPQVVDFLIGSALFWCEKMHIDGLRVDAVASMLWRDFGRQPGQWVPNKFGGSDNIEAVAFLRQLNQQVHEKFPQVMMIAEESHAFPRVCFSDGLCFDMKWNMGWMNDTLRYFCLPLDQRSHHHYLLTHTLSYAFCENFLLPLSQDEVVHWKRSLFSKQPDFPFAGVRLLRSYQMCQPGKKLIFMGAEMGQPTEWNEKQVIPWELLDHPQHKGLWEMFLQLNHLYLNTPALWELDFASSGFAWIDAQDAQRAVLSYRRIGFASQVVCVHNFSRNDYPRYVVQEEAEKVHEIFNSDKREFGGEGRLNLEIDIVRNQENEPIEFVIHLPPLTTCIFAL